MDKLKTTSAPTVIGAEGESGTRTTDFTLKMPKAGTLPALVLAIMLKGREISTPSFTYSKIHATRLPAYIQRLEDISYQGSIITEPLPLTESQLKRRYRKPFSKYYLDPALITDAGKSAQMWANEIIKEFEIQIDKFPMARAAR